MFSPFVTQPEPFIHNGLLTCIKYSTDKLPPDNTSGHVLDMGVPAEIIPHEVNEESIWDIAAGSLFPLIN